MKLGFREYTRNHPHTHPATTPTFNHSKLESSEACRLYVMITL
ncbi:hypothetical protein Hanom_Chr04g00284391 [Helianthus anomalus]